MRKVAAVLFIFSVVSFLFASQTDATQFNGTPSPSLSPTFGTLINFDDKATETAVLFNDYLSLGIASITETEGLGVFAR